MRAMAAVLVGGLLGASLALAQQPPDESNLSENEKRIPPGHYCKAMDVPLGRNETRAHHCDCKFSCSVDEQGNVTERESPDCKAFCHKNGRRCTCHTEEPCDLKGAGRVDMNGQLVAMAVRRHQTKATQ